MILVPGPAHEVQVVRDIYGMLISGSCPSMPLLANSTRRVSMLGDSKWNHHAVHAILTHPKYTGCHVFGRTSGKLYTPVVRLPKSEWVFTPGAFQPIVDQATYLEAQRILQSRTTNKSDHELLDHLRGLLAIRGRLSLSLIKNSEDVPSPSTYRLRFGSLRRAYELIGYGRPDQFGPIDVRRRTQALREELITQIAGMFPNDVSVVRRGGRWRSQLRLTNGSIVSVVLARSVRVWKQTVRWRVVPLLYEQEYVTLLARLSEGNASFLDFHVIPSVDRVKTFDLRLADSWLNRGQRLGDLLSFVRAVSHVAQNLAP